MKVPNYLLASLARKPYALFFFHLCENKIIMEKIKIINLKYSEILYKQWFLLSFSFLSVCENLHECWKCPKYLIDIKWSMLKKCLEILFYTHLFKKDQKCSLC